MDVIDEGFDVVIRTGQLSDTCLKMRHLASFRMLAVPSPAYLRDHGEPAAPYELLAPRLIRMRMPQTGRLQRWGLGIAGNAMDENRPAIICNDLATIVTLTRAARGIAHVPLFAISEHIANGTLVRVMGEHGTGKEAFEALCPSGRLVTPKVRAFVKFADVHLKAAVQ